MDDGGQGYNDTVNIANNATIKDWADIKGGQGNDTITAGDNLLLIARVYTATGEITEARKIKPEMETISSR